MKTIIQKLGCSALVLSLAFCSTTFADPVTIPNSFSAGQPAVASEVNANFSVVETAVNANDEAIDLNASNITTNGDGITANSDNLIEIQSRLSNRYWVSVNPNAFVTENSSQGQAALCELTYNPSNALVLFRRNASAGNADCDMIGGIQLPDNHTIVSMQCGQSPGSTSATIELKRVRQAGSPSIETITSTPAPELSGGHVTSVSSSIEPGTELIANQNYSYFIYVDVDTSDFTDISWGLSGCSIEVQPSDIS